MLYSARGGRHERPFARFGPQARLSHLSPRFTRFSPENLMNRACSLNLEHVSPATLMRLEISRHPACAAVDEATTLALLRRWFFARKPDAGFVLTDFPATLLQAKVLDEWLDARDEALSAAIVAGPGSPGPVVSHYRTLGLLVEAGGLAA